MNDRSATAVRVGRLLLLLLATRGNTAAAQASFVLDSNALGSLRACELLSTINRTFPEARDTMIHGEGGSQWPAKIAYLDRHSYVIFESSWTDTTHLWTIRTNSPRFRTRRGYHVGMRVGDLINKVEHFTAELAEGQLGLTLVSENIGVGIDARARAKFPVDWPAGNDATAVLDTNARITIIAAGGSCPH